MAEKNIFREAKELWEKKRNGVVLTEEEEKLLGAGMIPLNRLPQYNNIEISEGLEELAQMLDGKHC